MDSGDGKTLASAIAAAVFAAAGRRVHVLTANDYLASRDCDELAPMLEPLGLSVGLVIDNMDRDERRHQYARQIVFTTAREVRVRLPQRQRRPVAGLACSTGLRRGDSGRGGPPACRSGAHTADNLRRPDA